MLIIKITLGVMAPLMFLGMGLFLCSLVLLVVALVRGMRPGMRYGLWQMFSAGMALHCPMILCVWFWMDMVRKSPMSELIVWRNVTIASFLILPWIGLYLSRKCLKWAGEPENEARAMRVCVSISALLSLAVHTICLLSLVAVIGNILYHVLVHG